MYLHIRYICYICISNAQAKTVLTMGMSLSSLQATGISSNIYNTTCDLWDLLNIRLNVTMEHAVNPSDFVETLWKISLFSYCRVFKHKARVGIFTNIFQLKKQELCFPLDETNATYLSSYLLKEAYIYVGDFIGLWEK